MTPAYVENLTQFFAKLRECGLTVGISEAIDVLELLDGVVLSEKEVLRVSMRSILAKTTREQEIFDARFDEFFVPMKVRQQQETVAAELESQRESEREEILEQLSFDGRDIELPDELRDAYVNMSSDKRERLNNYLGISTENERRSPFSYKFMQRILEQHLKLEDAEYEPEDAGEGLDGENLLYKDISLITEDEMPKAVALIQVMVKQLNGAISRKYKRSSKTGRLDFRQTIRAGMGTGGSFYKLKYRKRPRSRKKLVLLCDVSGSMLQYSEFVIRFIKSMSDVSDASKIFVFSEGLCEVSPFVLQDMSTFREFVKNNGLWGKGTDIGAALDELRAQRPYVLGGNTVLMIISDTKSVRLSEARRSMQVTVGETGKTIWLNPIPSRKWLKLNSVATFSDLCQMLDCSTINELTRACAKTLFG